MNVVCRCFCLLAGSIVLAFAANDEQAAIQKVLTTQVDAWNRGDIPTFVTTYAEDCLFVGKEVAHGREQLLARYRKQYPDRAAMGHLNFAQLEIHSLTPDVAIVAGEWHLERSGTEKSIGGRFSLVFHREREGWKIALDHTH